MQQQQQINDRCLFFNPQLATRGRFGQNMNWDPQAGMITGITATSNFYVPRDMPMPTVKVENTSTRADQKVSIQPTQTDDLKGESIRVMHSHHRRSHRSRHHHRSGGKSAPTTDPSSLKKNIPPDKPLTQTQLTDRPNGTSFRPFCTSNNLYYQANWGHRAETVQVIPNISSNPNNVPFGVFPYYVATPSTLYQSEFIHGNKVRSQNRTSSEAAVQTTEAVFTPVVPVDRSVSPSIPPPPGVYLGVRPTDYDHLTSPPDTPPLAQPCTYAGFQALRTIARIRRIQAHPNPNPTTNSLSALPPPQPKNFPLKVRRAITHPNSTKPSDKVSETVEPGCGSHTITSEGHAGTNPQTSGNHPLPNRSSSIVSLAVPTSVATGVSLHKFPEYNTDIELNRPAHPEHSNSTTALSISRNTLPTDPRRRRLIQSVNLQCAYNPLKQGGGEHGAFMPSTTPTLPPPTLPQTFALVTLERNLMRHAGINVPFIPTA